MKQCGMANLITEGLFGWTSHGPVSFNIDALDRTVFLTCMALGTHFHINTKFRHNLNIQYFITD
jgi:hypothetical protein